MRESDDMNRLPETYARALRLRSEGLGDEAIGRVLDIETESVGPLLDLAASKLAGLACRCDHGSSGGTAEGPVA
jgi:DNA-directed RNA polymerase specialized sigma24 family protein